MELKSLCTRWLDFLKKYKYPALILLIGVLFMLIPTGKKSEKAIETPKTVQQVSINEELAALLSQIDGAGKVSVMLTVAKGEETLYQTNDKTSGSGEMNSIESDTVTVTDAQRNETGLIRQINPARFLGVVVVCQGADDPHVRLAVVDAVSKLTGLGADKISVAKMK